jgi:hypothetical protein
MAVAPVELYRDSDALVLVLSEFANRIRLIRVPY